MTEYKTQGDCDGFPKVLGLETAPGLCVGLVDDGGGDVALKLPRQIEAFGDDLIVTDMAGWGEGNGRIFLLKKLPNGRYRRHLLMSALDLPREHRHWLYMPSTIRRGPDGKPYVGATSTVIRFDVPFAEFGALENPMLLFGAREKKAAELRQRVRDSIEVVLDNLPYLALRQTRGPDDPDSLHPLKPLLFDARGDLFMGTGADSDNCNPVDDPNVPCAEGLGTGPDREGARAVILKYTFDKQRSLPPRREIYAEGLRNGMAMAIRPGTEEIWEGENSREVRNATKMNPLGPYDELNLIEKGVHYGWPYCEEGGTPSREYSSAANLDCSKYRPAALFLPPHSAPLSMFFYTGRKLPAWYRGRLIVALHSREKFGHRVSTFARDDDGRPTGRPLDLIRGWGTMETMESRPLGTPMGMVEASDGSIIVTEDNNRKILRISVDRDASARSAATPNPADDEWINKAR